MKRKEGGLWQRRYWAHLMTDEKDYNAHMDYVHINPLKHGLVSQVGDWPFSTFHKYVEKGEYPRNWASGEELGLNMMIDEVVVWRITLH